MEGNGLRRQLSWKDSGGSVLKMSIRLLFLGGVWPLNRSRLMQAYGALIFSVGLATCVDGALAVYFTWRQMEATTLVLTNTFTIGSGVVKMALFVHDRPLYCALVRRLDALVSSQDEYCAKDARLLRALEDSRRFASRFPLAGFLFMLAQACLWLPMPALAYPGQRRLPFVQHDWSGNASHRYYQVSYAQQCCSAFWLGKISVVLDCQFVAIMVLVTAQLKILASQDFATVLKCVAFLPVPCGQVFIYCWAADNMTEQARAVSDAAYRARWAGGGARLQRCLLLVMARAQRRLLLSAGHLYIDRAAFLSLVNASYSFYTLLAQMNRK